jgi:multiple RNA-binding domain-containing protein 1
LKEYQEFRAVMKETIQEPGKDQKAPVQKKEKKDKGKEKAVEEEEEEEVEEDDDSAWLANKRKEALAEDSPAEATKSNVSLFHTAPSCADNQLSNQEQLILSSRRLFVRNLAFVTTRDELRDYFSTYGPIEECHLPVSKDKQQPLGTAYILFKDANDALEAYRKLDRRIFQGRILQVIASEPKNGWYGHSDPEFASHVLGKSDKAKGEVKKDIQKKSLENVKWAELYLNVSPILQYSR